MNRLTVAGGLYHERCIWPDWNRVLGSGGRAAAAVVEHVDTITFHTYASPSAVQEFRPQAEIDKLDFRPKDVDQFISFEYVHSLSTPVITPSPSQIERYDPIDAEAEVVLRFGMLEGTARVEAERCVYDPQSALAPEPFKENGSYAGKLAIVGNRSEICELAGDESPSAAGARLVEEGAEVVVIKSGAEGAQVITASDATSVPPYRSDAVWTLGSGDVFAAMFAARWAVHRDSPVEAALLASAAVSSYAESRELQVPPVESLLRREAVATKAISRKVYLASPFFTVSELWLVDDVRRGLSDLGLEVFSPLHEVGPGPAGEVAPADIAALKDCDIVFAILDGLDSGTVFEVGYARALEKPVYAFAQNVSRGDLTMIEGSGCRVYNDLVTALHHAAWRE
ncbi:MAG: nucleoside 2-deoxyribosyltransferase [Gammaproteobacteria bacterium]|nr:nucleoside 2-deoxyribosyltransferase [Gammaproteobacteria bacterium]